MNSVGSILVNWEKHFCYSEIKTNKHKAAESSVESLCSSSPVSLIKLDEMALTPHRRFLSEAPVLTVSSLRSAPATADRWIAHKARAECLVRDAVSGRALGSILMVDKHPP